jgi:HK97 family phage portal protein
MAWNPFRRNVVMRQDEEEESPFTDAFQYQVDNFWAELAGTSVYFSPTLTERVWVAERCIQLNAQQIAAMPLRHHGTSDEPAWVANPDPVWYPNGLGDAIFSCIQSLYGYGDAFIYVTSRYADGFPRGWTVLDPSAVTVEVRGGRRVYKSGQNWLDADNMIQVSRNPRAGAIRGTSALKSFAGPAYGLMAANDLGRVMMAEGAVPNAVLKSNRKLTAEQAEALQEQWISRTAVRRGAPAVLPPDIDFQLLSFSPSDLLLLDAQEFNARIICAAFGVPAMFLNLSIEGGLTYQSAGMAGEFWWRFELRPMANFLAKALSAQMLPRDSWVEFDARHTIAPTYKEWTDSLTQMYEKGLLQLEEARALLLGIHPTDPDPISEFLTPPSAGASPAQQPASVVQLRPTQAGEQ